MCAKAGTDRYGWYGHPYHLDKLELKLDLRFGKYGGTDKFKKLVRI